MKTLTALRVLFFVVFTLSSGRSDAVSIEFIGPCSVHPILSEEISRPTAQNAGELTVQILNRHGIAYRGSAAGIAEAFGAPSGLDANVVISDEEMLSYGWCYSVDGVAPDVYPDQIPLTAKTAKIEWFYAYSHYVRGEWVAQCVHAWKRPIPGFCAKR
jgi:hypothetical protein